MLGISIIEIWILAPPFTTWNDLGNVTKAFWGPNFLFKKTGNTQFVGLQSRLKETQYDCPLAPGLALVRQEPLCRSRLWPRAWKGINSFTLLSQVHRHVCSSASWKVSKKALVREASQYITYQITFIFWQNVSAFSLFPLGWHLQKRNQDTPFSIAKAWDDSRQGQRVLLSP